MPKNLTTDTKSNLIASLGTLFSDLETAGEPIPPLVFLQVFRSVYPQFAEQDRSGYMQQDAEEAWGQIIQVLSEKVPGLLANKELHPTKRFVEQFMTVDTLSTCVSLVFHNLA